MSNHELSAKVILDSISPTLCRLTTMEVTIPRILLAEFNTHCAFARNSASSRAIPAKVNIDAAWKNPFIPLEWGSNKAGMQPGEPILSAEKFEAESIWFRARDAAAGFAEELNALGVHKQIVNRLIEPFLWQTIVVTAAEWDNFFRQRARRFTPDAQHEFGIVADMMYVAFHNSTPTKLGHGEWHTPYINPLERTLYTPDELCQLSVARCAGISYGPGRPARPPQKDFDLYKRLNEAQPPHWSPFEHVAIPSGNPNDWRKFTGWKTLRKCREEEREDKAYWELLEDPEVG